MLSRSQIDKLGERLKSSAEVEPADLTVLQTLRSEHDAAMLAVARRLIDELGVEPGTRLKTVGTIVDKLRRESIRLSQMQDIAGVRLVADMSLVEQDQLVERVAALFPGARVVDRRANPSHGYRAVHVIVELDRRFVEVQVRTLFQHFWAQGFERLADAVGREIRYGELPVAHQESAAVSVANWLSVSAYFREMEKVGRHIELLRQPRGVRQWWQARRLRRHYRALRRDVMRVVGPASRTLSSVGPLEP